MRREWMYPSIFFLALGILFCSGTGISAEPQRIAQERQADGTGLNIRELLGRSVIISGGKKIGEVETLVSEEGRPKFVIVAGEDGRMYPIPVDSVKEGVRSGELMVALEENDLEQAPSFKKGQWPDITAKEFGERVHAYYRRQTGAGSALARAEAPRSQGEARWRERVIGKRVRNLQGQELGTVEDVMSSPFGNDQYVIVSHDSLWGIHQELTPIPWQVVELDPAQNALVVDIDREKLRNAPKIREGGLPGLQQPEWEQKVRSYYGLQERSGPPRQ
jgi:sporulation protein YlmC with PRC-barrel domain